MVRWLLYLSLPPNKSMELQRRACSSLSCPRTQLLYVWLMPQSIPPQPLIIHLQTGEADAKLLLAILKVSDVKPDFEAVAQQAGPHPTSPPSPTQIDRKPNIFSSLPPTPSPALPALSRSTSRSSARLLISKQRVRPLPANLLPPPLPAKVLLAKRLALPLGSRRPASLLEVDGRKQSLLPRSTMMVRISSPLYTIRRLNLKQRMKMSSWRLEMMSAREAPLNRI